MEKDKPPIPKDLDELIERTNRLLADMRVWRENLRELLARRDQMEELAVYFETKGIQVTPQRNAIRTIDTVLRGRAGGIARELGRPSLSALRAERKPPREHWWWHLDLIRREERGRWLRRVLLISAVVLGVLAVVILVVERLSAKQAAVVGHLLEAEGLYLAGGYQKALEEAQKAAGIVPDDSTPYVWQSIIYEKLGGHEGESALAFAKVVELSRSKADAYIERAVVLYQLGDLASSRRDVETVLDIDPRSARAYYLLAGISFSEGKLDQAREKVEKALEYGKDDAAVQVMGKMLLAQIMESVAAPPAPTGTGR